MNAEYLQRYEYLELDINSKSLSFRLDTATQNRYKELGGYKISLTRTLRRLLADFAVARLGASPQNIEGFYNGDRYRLELHPFIQSLPENWEDEALRLNEDLYVNREKEIITFKSGRRASIPADTSAVTIGIYPFIADALKGRNQNTLIARYLTHAFLQWIEPQ